MHPLQIRANYDYYDRIKPTVVCGEMIVIFVCVF